MIHYHGTPITPVEAAIRVLRSRHAFISFAEPRNLDLAAEFCQSFAVDNGAFTAWKQGRLPDWPSYYAWVARASRLPNFDWAIMPDVIDGTEQENDDLLKQWPLPSWMGVPVWHVHESLGRLEHLVRRYSRIALGSSGEFSKVGTQSWWERMKKVMGVLCDAEGYPRTKIHGLRMLNPKVFGVIPLSSADSTNVAQNNGTRWSGQYEPATAATKSVVIAERVELAPHATRYLPQ